MAENRRACRSKLVDYSKFAGGDDFDDDDFSSFTPPVTISKKPKKESRLKKREKTKAEPLEVKENSASITSRKKTERQSLDEKAYERQLQLALEISMQDGNSKRENQATDVTSFPKNDSCDSSVTEQSRTVVVESACSDEAKEAEVSSLDQDNIIRKGVKRKSDAQDLDKIEVLETGIEEDVICRRRKRNTSKAKKYVESDDDSDCDVEINTDDADFKLNAYSHVNSQSDFSGSDSDYEEKKPKSKKPAATIHRKTKNNVSSGPAKKNTSKLGGSVQQKGSGLEMRTETKSPAVVPAAPNSNCRTPLMSKPLGTSLKKQAWTPPGSAGTGKSPGSSCALNLGSPSGGIRLGLSKRARVKSLHPSVQV